MEINFKMPQNTRQISVLLLFVAIFALTLSFVLFHSTVNHRIPHPEE